MLEVTFHPPAALQLARSATTAGDGEHPFDAGAIGPNALVMEPAADGLAGQVLG